MVMRSSSVQRFRYAHDIRHSRSVKAPAGGESVCLTNGQVLAVSSEATPRATVSDAARIAPPVLHPEFGRINPVSLDVRLKSGVSLDVLQSLYHQAEIKRPDDREARIAVSGDVPADQAATLCGKEDRLLASSSQIVWYKEYFQPSS